MGRELITKTRKILYTNAGLAVVSIVFVVLVATALLPSNKFGVKQSTIEPIREQETVLSAPVAVQGPVMERSEPVRLRIPKVGIDTTFERPLGLNQDSTVEVPDSYEEVGWYQYAPTPGELGPAVILGHVDSYEGPAVFYRLGSLKPGDEITVDRADGTTAKFEVTTLERHEQSGFPTELVYGDIDHAGLRLITCSGVFVRGEQRYTHNLIVFARLVE
jgi:sortase (surface protein transpeptidase)